MVCHLCCRLSWNHNSVTPIRHGNVSSLEVGVAFSVSGSGRSSISRSVHQTFVSCCCGAYCDDIFVLREYFGKSLSQLYLFKGAPKESTTEFGCTFFSFGDINSAGATRTKQEKEPYFTTIK